jgi:hypothetical protein
MAIVFRPDRVWWVFFLAVFLGFTSINWPRYGSKNRSQLEGSIGIGL